MSRYPQGNLRHGINLNQILTFKFHIFYTGYLIFYISEYLQNALLRDKELQELLEEWPSTVSLSKGTAQKEFVDKIKDSTICSVCFQKVQMIINHKCVPLQMCIAFDLHAQNADSFSGGYVGDDSKW